MANPEELRLALKLVERAAEIRTIEENDDWTDEGSMYLDEPVTAVGWQQSRWVNYAILPDGFCLTSGCLAGHVAIHAGYDQIATEDRLAVGICNQAGDVLTWSGPGSVAQYAKNKLGLNSVEAEILFDAQNSLDDIRGIVQRLCE